MNAYLGTMYADKIMEFDEYQKGTHSEAYKNFYYRYMKIQFFLNFITNIQSKMEYELETRKDFDWDKQYNDELFQVGYKNNHFNFNAKVELKTINRIRNDVKGLMNLTKDHFYIQEEAALHEFLQLFSILECYLQDLYREIINTDKSKFTKKLNFSSMDEKLLLEKLASGEEINEDFKKEILENAINNHLMQNVVEFIASILKSIPRSKVQDFRDEIKYDEFIKFLNEMRELRNLHTHKIGIKDGKYQNVFGLYITDALRGGLYHLIPRLDELVVENVLIKRSKDMKK